MEEKNKEECPKGLMDEKRVSYMISWRDRHIEKQNELIRGYEENLSLMEALLAFALWRESTPCGEERVAHIPKKELGEMIGRYASEVREGEDVFSVFFRPVQEPIDGGEQNEG